MALAITPRGEFGYLRSVQGFKSRPETLARTGPHSDFLDVHLRRQDPKDPPVNNTLFPAIKKASVC